MLQQWKIKSTAWITVLIAISLSVAIAEEYFKEQSNTRHVISIDRSC